MIVIVGLDENRAPLVRRRFPKLRFRALSRDASNRADYSPSAVHVVLVRCVNHSITDRIRRRVPKGQVYYCHSGITGLLELLANLKGA